MRPIRWFGVVDGLLALAAAILLVLGLAFDDRDLGRGGNYVLLAAVIVGFTPLGLFGLYRAYERFKDP